jgi:hypothetical protein
MTPLIRNWRRGLPYIGGIAALLLFAAALVVLHSPRTSVPAKRGASGTPKSSSLAAVRRVSIGRGKLFVVDPLRRSGASPCWADAAVSSRRARLLHWIRLQPHSGLRESYRPLNRLPSLHADGTYRRRGRRNLGVRDSHVYDRARRGLSSGCAAGSIVSRDARNIAACRYRHWVAWVDVDGRLRRIRLVDGASGPIIRLPRSTFRDRKPRSRRSPFRSQTCRSLPRCFMPAFLMPRPLDICTLWQCTFWLSWLG